MTTTNLKLVASIALLICCFVSNYGQDYEAIINQELRHQSPGGSVLIAKEGKVVYHQSYGKVNIELGVEATNDHVYRIASLSKQFTAIAILKLVEEGKIALTDNVTKYINDYPTQGHTITIEHLLTHTSGIKDYLNIKQFTAAARRNDMVPREIIDFFKAEPMDFPPGTQFSYSSSGYIILGYIIEIVSGMSYEDYMNKYIFEAINLSNTRYDNEVDIISNRASGYRDEGNAYKNASYLSMTLPYAAGALVSTTEDLFQWNQALTKQKIVTANTLDIAHKAYVLQSGRKSPHGYGWEIGNVQGKKSVKHSGKINGFISYALSVPEEDIYVVILTNCESIQNIETIATKLAALALDQPYALNAITLPKADLESMNGVYESKFGQQKLIRFENGQLFLFDRGKTKNKLIPFAKDQFFIEGSLTTWSIIKDQDTIQLEENNTNQIITWKLKDSSVTSISPEKITIKELKKYLGKYELAPDLHLKIHLQGNVLIGQIKNEKKKLMPIGNHKFIARDIDAELTFNLVHNEVISLTLDQGRIMTAKKVE